MATPGNYSLILYRGDSYRWQFKLWSDAAKTIPVDLTGVTPKAEIRDKPSGVIKAALVCTVEAPNIIDMELPATDCAKLVAKQVWDLQLTYASGEVTTVLAGPVVVTFDVTDSGAASRAAR